MAFSIGISMEEFKHLSPKKLGYCLKGYEQKRKMHDEEMWFMGAYVKEAFWVVMSHFGAGLAGKKSHAKYLEKPIMREIEESQKQANLTEEEKIKQTQQFFLRLKLMQTNYELSHKDGTVS